MFMLKKLKDFVEKSSNAAYDSVKEMKDTIQKYGGGYIFMAPVKVADGMLNF